MDLTDLSVDELIFMRACAYHVQTSLDNSFSNVYIPEEWVQAHAQRALTANERIAINVLITGSPNAYEFTMRRECGHDACGN